MDPQNIIFEVIEETVGQCVGIEDKNHILIFEGDIVNVKRPDNPLFSSNSKNLIVKFDEYCRFVAEGNLTHALCPNYEWEVIGNIHDKNT